MFPAQKGRTDFGLRCVGSEDARFRVRLQGFRGGLEVGALRLLGRVALLPFAAFVI